MNTPFQILQDEWIQIAPVGDFPHQMGIQRLDAEAIANMTSRFNGFLGRMGRLFAGVPVFNGHHDTNPAQYPDGKSYGWIMALDNRGPEGLWGKVKWTEAGRALIANGAFKFVSPVWNAKEISRQGSRPVYRPDTLLSLALTNTPNLPLPPMANEESNMNTITQLLELPNDATADQICSAVTTLKNSVLSPQSSQLKAALNLPETATADEICAAAEALASSVTTLENSLRTQDSELSTLKNTQASALSTVQDRLFTAILDNAVTAGKITLAERPKWLAELQKDEKAALANIAAAGVKLPTDSQTRDLGKDKRVLENEATRRTELTAYIAKKQAEGLTYDQAWALAKKECAPLFEQMARK